MVIVTLAILYSDYYFCCIIFSVYNQPAYVIFVLLESIMPF